MVSVDVKHYVYLSSAALLRLRHSVDRSGGPVPPWHRCPPGQRSSSAGRAGAGTDVRTAQVWQPWGRVARHPPRPATGPQPCVGPPSPPSSVHSSYQYPFIVQELCESRGGRPGLSVLTSLLVSVDVKIYWTVLRHWSQLVPNMSADIRGH